MKISELEKYRNEDGYIDIDKFENENSVKKVPELRGASNKEKDWFKLEDGDILIRTENLFDEGVIYSTYAELIFEELANQVDIPTAHYDLVTYKGKKGVLSQNVARNGECLISMKDLLDCGTKKHDIGDDQYIHVKDAIRTFKTFYKEYGDFPKEDYTKLCNDFLNMAIFDIYAISTDRHAENCGVLYDGKNVRLAPMFDNECSLLLDSPQDKIADLNARPSYIRESIDLEYPRIYYTYEDEDYGEEVLEDNSDKLLYEMALNIDNNFVESADWQNTICNLSEFGDEQMKFIKKCNDKLDIKVAIQNVEERIGTRLPNELTEFVIKVVNTRKKMISNELDFDDLELGI